MDNTKKIAVITGASSGMGREFALRIDGEEKFDEVWLIARRAEKLEEIAKVCKNPARAIPMDLSKPEAWAEYKSMLESENAQKENTLLIKNPSINHSCTWYGYDGTDGMASECNSKNCFPRFG